MTRDTCFQHIGVREHGCVSYSSLGGLNDLSSLKSFIFYILIILFNFLLIVVTLFPSVSVFLIPLILLRQIASFVFFIAFLLAVTIHIYFLFLMFSYSCKLPCPCQCNFLFIFFFLSAFLFILPNPIYYFSSFPLHFFHSYFHYLQLWTYKIIVTIDDPSRGTSILPSPFNTLVKRVNAWAR